MDLRREFDCNVQGFAQYRCEKCGLPANVIYCVRGDGGGMVFEIRCWEHGEKGVKDDHN